MKLHQEKIRLELGKGSSLSQTLEMAPKGGGPDIKPVRVQGV